MGMDTVRKWGWCGLTGFWEQVKTLFWNIIHRPTWIDYIDIIIIAVLIYQLVLLTRQTRAIQVLKGLAMIIVASYLSELMGLTTLNWLLRSILNNGVIVLLVLFQPELRRALEQIGRSTKLDRSSRQDESERIVDEITQCLLRLSRRRVGALRRSGSSRTWWTRRQVTSPSSVTRRRRSSA